jgi:predicted transposase/invertase (TIGR01784 family)
MRRDSIFYALFQRSPALLFDLLEQQPPNAQQYRFESVAVKEPKFEIDGIFLPPDSQRPGVIYACEVQFQCDEQLYERMFGELFLYFYRNRQHYSNWRAVVIYPSRQQEQVAIEPYRILLESDHVQRVYLKELGPIDQLPLGLALMVLTTKTQKQAPAAAREILARSQAVDLPQAQRQAIMDMIGTIMTYQFNTLSREEIDQMLGITLKETQVYQEAREDEARSLILRQLNRRVGTLPDSVIERINALSIDQLESLGEALLDFATVDDLTAWLQENE